MIYVCFRNHILSRDFKLRAINRAIVYEINIIFIKLIIIHVQQHPNTLLHLLENFQRISYDLIENF